MTGEIIRLYPQSATELPTYTTVYEDLELPPTGHNGRPYVFINMVSSLDGRTAVEGKASGIGTAMDRKVMRTLRSKADAVMIGAGTLRAERLSLGLDAEDRAPRPLAVVLGGTGDIPLEENLVRDGRQKVLVLLADSAAEAVGGRLGRHVDLLRVQSTGSGVVDLANALEVLKAEHNVNHLLVEGGPSLNRALISENLVDEIFITLAPTLLGTDGAQAPAFIEGPLAERQTLQLLSAYLTEDELFLRYSLHLLS